MKLCSGCKAALEAERKLIRRAILDEKPIEIPEGMTRHSFQVNLHNVARGLNVSIVTRSTTISGRPAVAIWQRPIGS